MNYTIRVAKTKALISFAVTAKLICAFGFAYADCLFSHEVVHLLFFFHKMGINNCSDTAGTTETCNNDMTVPLSYLKHVISQVTIIVRGEISVKMVN